MADVVIERVGNWHVVLAVWEASDSKPGHAQVYGSFRNINDALDLRRTLLEALEGNVEVKRWEDPA